MATPLAPAARPCLDLAAAAAPALVERAVEQAVASLQQEEDQSRDLAQRRALADAWLALLREGAGWPARITSLLRAAQEATPEERPAQPAAASRTVLALVDDAAIAHAIESARLAQLIAPRLETPLAELDTLMSSALGLAAVQPERNPLRPQVFAQAVRELMQDAPPEFAPLWTRHIAPALAEGIAGIYAQALDLLRNSDLKAARYRVLPVAPSAARAAAQPPAAADHPAPAGSGGASGTGNGGAAAGAATGGGQGGETATPGFGGAAWADLSRHELGDELFQHFLYARTPPSTQGLAPAYYQEVEREIAAVQAAPTQPYDPVPAQQHRALPPVERPHRPVDTATPLDDAVWGRWAPARERQLERARLKKEARQVGQVLGLEVVRKLVDQVGRDPRLLAPVREAMVALEPALLRLALLAPRFFSQENHAGRRLVERVAERSFRYNDEFSSEFQAFVGDVRPLFQALNEAEIQDETPFARALDHLEELWTGQDALEAPGRQVAQDAMYFAEARDAEAGQIAWSLSQRSDLEGVPAAVQDFLYGPWALVMAHARLTDDRGQVDPGGWNAVITDLLWSVKPEQALREPARLVATIPPLLQKLRSGLELLGQRPAENDAFFRTLERLHRPVLKLRARSRRGSSEPVLPEPELDPALLSTERQQPRRSPQPWMGPAELARAGFEEAANSAAAPLAEDSGPVPLDAPGDGEVARLVQGLREGSWVDLHARGQWRRASLTWVNARATLFMFVSHGGQPHSMTRRSLERLLRQRLLRPVEGGAVVERALDELSQRRARPQPLAA